MADATNHTPGDLLAMDREAFAVLHRMTAEKRRREQREMRRGGGSNSGRP